MQLNKINKKIISEVVSIPTAPFHEQKVIAYVVRFCLKNGFPLTQDSSGNLFIRYKRGAARQPVVFTAHMDHPGFEVLSVKGRVVEVGILGGVKLDYFRAANVIISTCRGLVKGKVRAKLKKKWMGKSVFKVEVKAKAESKVRKGDFGYYDLVGVRFKNSLVYTKSADNLAGTALLLDLLMRLKKKRVPVDVTVVLTRAEEVGFVGCIAVAEGKLLKKTTPIIVIETSNAKAGGVDINGGPVIRVGDKQSGFMAEVDCWMHMVADDVSKRSKEFKYQRALLAGGRCEASAYMLKNYLVGGLAFPLGNYHNNGTKNYAPEYIGQYDYAAMLEFVFQLSVGPKIEDAFRKKKKELWDNFEKWKKFLSPCRCEPKGRSNPA